MSERVVLIGASRAGVTVACALRAAGAAIEGVWNRSPVAGDVLRTLDAPQLDTPDHEATLYLYSVSDDALLDLVESQGVLTLAASGAAAVHTSGVCPVSVLAATGLPTGGLHPLRSLPVPVVDGSGLRGVWCGVEEPGGGDGRLGSLVRSCGGRPIEVLPGRRDAYHAAASMGANLILALLDLSAATFRQAGLSDVDALAVASDLARVAVGNAAARGVLPAVTGPIMRGDVDVVARHIRTLDSDAARVYRSLSGALVRLLERGGVDISPAMHALVGPDDPA